MTAASTGFWDSLFHRHRFLRLWKRCGLRTALAIALQDRFGKGFYSIRPRGVPHPIRLRAGSSDSAVVVQIFDTRELAIDLPFVPRTIIDAGANNGISAIYFTNAYPQAAILAIEPDRDNFALCRENTRPYPNIRCVQAALWHQAGKLTLENPGASAWARRFEEGKEIPDGIEVEAITMRQAIDLAGGGGIDILKMDIEGAERELFRHEDGWMEQVRVLVLELHEQASPGCEAALEGALARSSYRRTQQGEKIILSKD